mgnify:CR=1 FL=1
MSDLNITVDHSSFTGNSSVIRNLNLSDAPESADIDFDRIIRELQEIKADLRRDTIDFQVVDKLEKTGRKRNWNELRSVAGKFASQFTNAVLANLAGAYLSGLLGL